MKIRLAEKEDAQDIADLLLTSFAEIKADYTAGGFEATVLDAEKVAARMDEGPVWIAVHEGEIIGTVSAVIKPRGLYMRGMAVAPGSRGQHVGRKLLETVEAFALHSACDLIYLSTAPYLLKAIMLYENFGFQRIDEPPYDLYGTPLFSMEKKL